MAVIITHEFNETLDKRQCKRIETHEGKVVPGHAMKAYWTKIVSRDSVVGFATHHELDDLGIESQWAPYFLHPSGTILGSIQPLIQWAPGLFAEGKAAGACR